MPNQNNSSSPNSKILKDSSALAQSSENLEQELKKAAEQTKEKIQQDPTTGKTLAATVPLQEEVIDIEKELINQIIIRLDQNKMTPDDAQNLAKEFLSFLPIRDKKDLLAKLLKLSQDNQAAQDIYLQYAKPHEESETQRKLTLMSQHLHAGKIEEALAVAKGGSHG